MKIKLLKATVCDGKVCKAGQVVDASEKSGRFLINQGRAVAAGKKPAAKRNKGLSTKDLEVR